MFIQFPPFPFFGVDVNSLKAILGSLGFPLNVFCTRRSTQRVCLFSETEEKRGIWGRITLNSSNNRPKTLVSLEIKKRGKGLEVSTGDSLCSKRKHVEKKQMKKIGKGDGAVKRESIDAIIFLTYE